MNAEEKKVWERAVEQAKRPASMRPYVDHVRVLTDLFLAADAELIRLREAVDWACSHEQTPSWPFFAAELRRRAGREEG